MSTEARARDWRARGAIALAVLATPSSAVTQTLAGTAITNVATMRDATGGATRSNVAGLTVAERLDCALARGDAGPSATVLLVLLTNPGNGSEAFVVAANAGASPRPIAVDSDGDGRFDPAIDHVLGDGTTPAVAPGATLRLLVPIDDAAGQTVTVTARAATGSGSPGTTLPGRGDGGGDAVVGATGAAARLTVTLVVEAPPTIVESQSVLASDGSGASRRGSIVTYTIVCRFASPSPAARVVNPVPLNTTYRSGTLTLDGAAIGDTGRVGDGEIIVPLGAVAAGAVHRITFQAIIQ